MNETKKWRRWDNRTTIRPLFHVSLQYLNTRAYSDMPRFAISSIRRFALS